MGDIGALNCIPRLTDNGPSKNAFYTFAGGTCHPLPANFITKDPDVPVLFFFKVCSYFP